MRSAHGRASRIVTGFSWICLPSSRGRSGKKGDIACCFVTSYDAASAGNVANQVQREFNGLGQMTKEYQAYNGTVNTGTTPKVQYTFSEMAGAANHSRLMSAGTQKSPVTVDAGTNDPHDRSSVCVSKLRVVAR